MTASLNDTNILVYSFDLAEPRKKKIARELLTSLQLYRQGFLRVQCVGEFFNVVSRGKLPKMTLVEAASQVENFLSDVSCVSSYAWNCPRSGTWRARAPDFLFRSLDLGLCETL